jgi:hypothetical protein
VAAHPPIPEQMTADKNKWLLVSEGVILQPLIERVICLLDPWFEKHGVKSFVTSGYRSAESQLRIIKGQAIKRGIQKHRPEIASADLYSMIDYEGSPVPVWAPSWNELLTLGFLVNPPIKTKTLMPYFHPALKVTIPKGTEINLSTHQMGRAFDVGGSGGADKTLKDELISIQDAMQSKTIPEIKSITPENINNAVHVTCQDV